MEWERSRDRALATIDEEASMAPTPTGIDARPSCNSRGRNAMSSAAAQCLADGSRTMFGDERTLCSRPCTASSRSSADHERVCPRTRRVDSASCQCDGGGWSVTGIATAATERLVARRAEQQ